MQISGSKQQKENEFGRLLTADIDSELPSGVGRAKLMEARVSELEEACFLIKCRAKYMLACS